LPAGFASLRSAATWDADAQATTLLLRTHGTALRVNMEAAVGAWLTVGIVDASGQPLPGLAAANCVQLGGNLLNAEVVWRRGQGGRSLGTTTQPFRIQFVMHGAVDIYAFRFAKTDDAAAAADRATAAPPLPPPLKPPLKPLVRVEWELLANLPVGVEDNDGGFLDDDTLVVRLALPFLYPLWDGVCIEGGLSRQTGFGLSKASYPGCVSTAFALNVSQPGAQWEALPAPPAKPRQEEAATVVSGVHGPEVWFCGGFNNDWKKQGNKQRTMDDMYRLYRDTSVYPAAWRWEQLPLSLPFPVDGHSIAAIGPFSHGLWSHFHAPLYISLVILRKKKTGQRGNDFTARARLVALPLWRRF
jgi:hypothetical protein